MCQNSKKRVYIDRYVRYLSATDDYVKELEGQVSLLDGLDGQQQENSFQSEQASAAAHVIPLHGLEQYQVITQSQIDQRSSVSQTNSTGRGGRRKGSVLSEEEKRERKRLNDAKYRYNKRVENEKLKDEINMLRSILQSSEQGKETEALSIHGPVQDLGSDRDLPAVVEDEPPRILEENQSPANPQDASYRDLLLVMHNDVQSQSLEENQPITYLQIDAGISQEENQVLTRPQFLATIQEMGDTSLEQVTEELIFKWRDCIAEAKTIKFNVDFATEHLKKIAKSYLNRKACNELSSIDKRIAVLEIELNDMKREKLVKLEMYSSQLLAASEDFHGNVGLF
ncbi:uncharacterized protein LOC110422312 isoform X2 [Herrania umbratica]|uniref:Uncharacterized protein LOC110422312 isoform X2 n=1 Tax=Herrania umbratica TaxID=108875 RepID=A0A6J1AXZ6_9ROSI|nr:uncharacterized protein LOC110422312 isoform X2 [Herrania umbratica]